MATQVVPPESYLAPLFSLSGQTALVTGSTRGIGKTVAKTLARAGANLILVQRRTSTSETAEEIKTLAPHVQVDVVQCDLGDKQSVKGLRTKVIEEMGLHVDILVNCAGIQRRTPAENFPDQDWHDVLQVNLESCFVLARDFGRHMLEARATAIEAGTPFERGRGKIINVASLVSFQGGITVPAYAAAKHGILGLTKALSNEWAAKGVNVNAIAPGYIATEMNTTLIANPTRSRQIMERIPAGRWGSPADFEGPVVFLASRASDYVSGECLVVDGGWMGR